jgi:hypothetical protein
MNAERDLEGTSRWLDNRFRCAKSIRAAAADVPGRQSFLLSEITARTRVQGGRFRGNALCMFSQAASAETLR